MRYFLFDCFGDIVGNPKGYKTFRGAAQAERLNAALLRHRYEIMADLKPYNRLLSRIAQA